MTLTHYGGGIGLATNNQKASTPSYNIQKLALNSVPRLLPKD